MLKKGLQADTDSEASANQQHQRISRGKGGGRGGGGPLNNYLFGRTMLLGIFDLVAKFGTNASGGTMDTV